MSCADRGFRAAKTVTFKSTDGGHTWSEASRFEFIDREFIAVDRTEGEHSGRIYIVGQASIRGIDGSRIGRGLKLFRSLDGGSTFLGPVHAQYPEGTEVAGLSTGAVLSDGTFVILFGLTKKGRQQNLEEEPTVGPNGELWVIGTKDGGETFEKAAKVTEWTFDRQRSEGGMLSQLAVDPGSSGAGSAPVASPLRRPRRPPLPAARQIGFRAGSATRKGGEPCTTVSHERSRS